MKRLLLLLALSSGLCGCRSLQLVEQDERVKIYERLPLLPHGYDYEVLEFKGKRYPYLYSYSYVYVAELDGIIFATQRGEGHVKLHFVPVHEGREITVSEGEYYSFGVDLGRPRDNSDADYVESVSDEKVTFYSPPGPFMRRRGDTAGRRYMLDLRERTFSELE